MGETESTPHSDDFVPVLDSASVMQSIREGREHSRIIWTPSTLLHWLGVPGVGRAYPKLLRRRAKRILKQLCDEGHLIRRPVAHGGWAGFEVAYMSLE